MSIQTIHTCCKDCVFAIYDGITQTDCKLSYIDKYKSKNIEVLEAYDDTKEFYIVNNKKCIGYRENKWFNQFDLSEATLDEKAAKYYETNKLHYLVVIDLKKISPDQLDQIVEQISSSSIKPQKIIFIRYLDNELKFPYVAMETLLQKYNVGCSWRIQTIVDETLSPEHILHNITSLNTQYRFILVIKDQNNDFEKIVSSANSIVHEELDQFIVLSNTDHSCIIYTGGMYRFESFHGNNLLSDYSNYTII